MAKVVFLWLALVAAMVCAERNAGTVGLQELPGLPSVTQLVQVDQELFERNLKAARKHPQAQSPQPAGPDDADFAAILNIYNDLKAKKDLIANQEQAVAQSEASLRQYEELLTTNKEILKENKKKLAATVKQLVAAVDKYRAALASDGEGDDEGLLANAEAMAATAEKEAAAHSEEVGAAQAEAANDEDTANDDVEEPAEQNGETEAEKEAAPAPGGSFRQKRASEKQPQPLLRDNHSKQLPPPLHRLAAKRPRVRKF